MNDTFVFIHYAYTNENGSYHPFQSKLFLESSNIQKS